MYVFVYVYIYIYKYISLYICIYTYTERERERDINNQRAAPPRRVAMMDGTALRPVTSRWWTSKPRGFQEHC